MGISYCNIYWDLHVRLPVMTHYPSSSCMGRLALTAHTTFLWRSCPWPQGTATLKIFCLLPGCSIHAIDVANAFCFQSIRKEVQKQFSLTWD